MSVVSSRSMMKVKYEKFCQAWRDEKLYQQVHERSGTPLPEGVQKLGRKPTFKMWMAAMANQRAAQAKVLPEKAVEVKDTSWEE
jgi:hypothetical protein